MTEQSEIPSPSDSDSVEDSIVLKPDKPVLFGKSQTPVKGYEICHLEELAGNKMISRYAVGFNLNGDHIIVFKPNKLILDDGKEYSSVNKVVIHDKQRGKFDLEGSYDAGVGGENLEKVQVRDKLEINGFDLVIEEGNRVKLESVIVLAKPL